VFKARAGFAGIAFRAQAPLPIEYKGLKLDCGYRLDLVVEDSLVTKLKSVDSLLPIHNTQVLTYLKLSRIKTGLLPNFNEHYLKDGIRRLVM